MKLEGEYRDFETQFDYKCEHSFDWGEHKKGIRAIGEKCYRSPGQWGKIIAGNVLAERWRGNSS